MWELFEVRSLTQKEMEKEIRDDITLSSGVIDPRYRSLNIERAAQEALRRFRGNVPLKTAIDDAMAQQGFQAPGSNQSPVTPPKQEPAQQQQANKQKAPAPKKTPKRTAVNPFKKQSVSVPTPIKGVTDFVTSRLRKGASIAKDLD